jgi:hypothetical protein
LNVNKIININILDKLNFRELKQLNLGCNGISDIQILDKVNFPNLEIRNFVPHFTNIGKFF